MSKYDYYDGANFPEDQRGLSQTEVRTRTGASYVDPDGWAANGYPYYRQMAEPVDEIVPPPCNLGVDWDADPIIVGLVSEYPWKYLSWSDCYEARRAEYTEQINMQIGDATVAQTTEDPLVEEDLIRRQAAASDKLDELSKINDADLGFFDPALVVAGPQDPVGYARLTLEIVEVTPWAGAPNATTGWKAILDIQKDYAVDGAEARISITESPAGIDGPLPFVEDPDDPNRWTCEARDGEKWEGDTGPVKAVLRWGSGSVLVGRELVSEEMYYRDAMNCRYGLPGR